MDYETLLRVQKSSLPVSLSGRPALASTKHVHVSATTDSILARNSLRLQSVSMFPCN